MRRSCSDSPLTASQMDGVFGSDRRVFFFLAVSFTSGSSMAFFLTSSRNPLLFVVMGVEQREASIGSNQLSKRCTAVSLKGCDESGFVVTFVMAWSPVRRFNAG
jgi:hypothetical protein